MSRRRKIVLAASLVGVAVLFLGLRLSLNRAVWSRIASSLHSSYGVDVTIDELSISLLSGRATLRGLRITDAEQVVIGADEVELSASIRDIVGGTYDLEKLVVMRPVVHIIVEKGETTNLARIFKRRQQTGDSPSSVILRDARIVDGRFVLDDARTDRDDPAHLVFEHIELAITELQISGKPRSNALGDIRLDAVLAQKHAPARITLVGWAPPLGGKLTIALHAAITGLDLEQIPQYVKSSTRRALGGDVIHLAGTMRAKDGVIADGAIGAEVVNTDAEFSLRFGGTTSDIVFDENSKLAALFHLPFAHLGHLGDVALTSTWGVALDLGTGLYDAGESVVGGVAGTFGGMIRLDPLGALEAASDGLIGGAQAIGGGIVGGVKHLFGGRESKAKEARKEAKQEREFSKLHAHCRRSMLGAALKSAKDSSAARRRRIEKELEPATAKPAAPPPLSPSPSDTPDSTPP